MCYLTTKATDQETLNRLNVLTTLTDGFALAEEDLNRRGWASSGEVQSGFQPFKVARLSDQKLVEETRSAAEALLQTDPQLHTAPLLAEEVAQKRAQLHPE